MLCHLAHSHLTFALPHHWTCDENAILGQLNRQNAKAPGVGGIPAQENSDLKNRFSARFVVGRGSQPQLPPMQLSGFRVRNLNKFETNEPILLPRNWQEEGTEGGGSHVHQWKVLDVQRRQRVGHVADVLQRGEPRTHARNGGGAQARGGRTGCAHTPGHSGGGTSPGA